MNKKQINGKRSVALKAVMKEKENKLRAKKLEMEANKGHFFEKPDEAIKVIITASEPDNTSDFLASCR